MSTYTQILYHIVFSTKNREPVLLASRREDLLKYIQGILKNKQCHLYRISAVTDHVHILCSIHPAVCLADLIREIKNATNTWITQDRVFPGFAHWQDGYGAFTLSIGEKDAVVEYIKNQETHHRMRGFREELCDLLARAGVPYDERYLP